MAARSAHRDIVMEARPALTKVCHQALVGWVAEGQPDRLFNKNRSTIDVRL